MTTERIHDDGLPVPTEDVAFALRKLNWLDRRIIDRSFTQDGNIEDMASFYGLETEIARKLASGSLRRLKQNLPT